MEQQFYQDLIHILAQELVKRNEPMKNHTSLHIGGEADYLVMPVTKEQVRSVIMLCKDAGIAHFVCGNGSNLLVSDAGYRGVIIKLGDQFSEVRVSEEGFVTAQSGVLLARLANEAARHSLTGLEFASGIPGTLGGAVTMNAGAYDGEMKQCLTRAWVMDEKGNILELSAEDLKLGYRTSILQSTGYIVLEAEMKLEHGDERIIREKMNDLNSRRRDKQPLDQYSAGSTFKRPQGYFAAKLIEDSGLRGYQVGGAAVSEKHCGFLINKDNASAKDFYALIKDVVRIVEEKFGVRMEPEVRFLGDIQ